MDFERAFARVVAAEDGVIGPVTRLRLQVADHAWILRRLQGARLDAYTRAKSWPTSPAP